MTVSTGPRISDRTRSSIVRMFHGATILVDLALLWVVDNLLAWDLLSFLTEEFSRVSGLIMFSLIASLVVNASLLVADRPRAGAIEKAVLALINLWATVQLFRVFPFDFSGFRFDWSIGVRVVLIVAIVGTVGEFVTSLTRLGRLQGR